MATEDMMTALVDSLEVAAQTIVVYTHVHRDWLYGQKQEIIEGDKLMIRIGMAAE
ncbi:hypothetical protein BDP27DRAFT_1432950 [Rhodocollybia butyracea]|uniref:Uncharacterized protein n=1 Tax=Rhodocollybia butyracea TaxID=206335 RepID=A0A9P5P9Q8_9AGAR|nr:hypothetical protein BDP27DRAFT_1432950 [Rhodocollybia butyracea]